MVEVVPTRYHDLFNAQKHIDDVSDAEVYPAIEALHPLIAAAKADGLIGLTRAHKHFDLGPDEVLLASLGGKYPIEVGDKQPLLAALTYCARWSPTSSVRR